MHDMWRNKSTRISPFKLLMGYCPQAEWAPTSSPLPQVTKRLDQLKQEQDKVWKAMEQAQQRWCNKQQKECTYQEGDYVWLDRCNIKTYHPTAKLVPKRHSPFKIARVLSAIMYQLELPIKWKLYPVFHVDLLMCHSPDLFFLISFLTVTRCELTQCVYISDDSFFLTPFLSDS